MASVQKSLHNLCGTSVVPKRGLKEGATGGTSIKVCLGSVPERLGPQSVFGACPGPGEQKSSTWIQCVGPNTAAWCASIRGRSARTVTPHKHPPLLGLIMFLARVLSARRLNMRFACLLPSDLAAVPQ